MPFERSRPIWDAIYAMNPDKTDIAANLLSELACVVVQHLENYTTPELRPHTRHYETIGSLRYEVERLATHFPPDALLGRSGAGAAATTEAGG